jgi:hypothetical protein
VEKGVNNTYFSDSYKEEFFSDSLWNKSIILFIMLCSISFFMLRGVGKGDRVLDFMGIGLIVLFILLFSIYSNKVETFKPKYSIYIILMFIGIIVSSLSCSYIHDQSLVLTIYQQRSTYFLLFYFVLHFMRPNPHWIKDLIFYFAIAGAIIYLLQYFAYPFRITETKMFYDRGTLRIFLPGSTFLHLGYFLSIDQYFRNKELKYGIGALLLFVIAILSGFRMILALYVLITAAYILLSKQIKNKILIIFLISLISVAGFLAFQQIINEMRTSAERETSQGEDYVRVRAASYFLSEIDKNRVTLITGNGQPNDKSNYGQRLGLMKVYYGYYLSDCGIIGSLYKFGIIFVIPALLLFFTLIFTKYDREFFFSKLFLILNISNLFIGFYTFEAGEGAIVISCIMYFSDMSQLQNQR